jgi:hypothetical protein
MPKAVLTPEGRFASVRLAATYYDIDYEMARCRIRSGWQGRRHVDSIVAIGVKHFIAYRRGDTFQ